MFDGVVVELSSVIVAFEVCLRQQTWCVDVPLLDIRTLAWRSVCIVAAIQRITFHVKEARVERGILWVEAHIDFKLLTCGTVVPNVTIHACVGMLIARVDVVLDASLTWKSVTRAQSCPGLREMWLLWVGGE